VDFVVVGFGFGALSVLLGFLLRDLVPWWFRMSGSRPMPEPVVRRRVAHGRAGRAGGAVLATAGALLALITLVTLLLNARDRTGLEVVFGALAVALLVILAWGFTYVQRFHSRPRGYRARTPVRRRSGETIMVDDVPVPMSEPRSRWDAFESDAAHIADPRRPDPSAWSHQGAFHAGKDLEADPPPPTGGAEDDHSPPEPDHDLAVAELDGVESGATSSAETEPTRQRRETALRANATGGG